MLDCSPEELLSASRYLLLANLVDSPDPEHANDNMYIEWALDTLEGLADDLATASLYERGVIWTQLVDIWETDVSVRFAEGECPPPAVEIAALAAEVKEALAGVVEPPEQHDHYGQLHDLWISSIRLHDEADGLALGYMHQTDHVAQLQVIKSQAIELQNDYFFAHNAIEY